jgi:beta-lactamase superfamily II metal-dependent hydrolase
MAIKYVSTDTAELFESATGSKVQLELLWGDRVDVVSSVGPRARVRARGKEGYVDQASLGDRALLELYFIDVGQGDGILIRTPDGRHVMIDGGYKRASQPTGKNAADFVDWKFVKDYGSTSIDIDVMLASHNDADHYGGLWDLLNADQNAELDAQQVHVESFFHAGLAWWSGDDGRRTLGPTSADGAYLTQLMGPRREVLAALREDANPKLQGEWAALMSCVTQARTRGGTPTPIRRLSHVDGYVPGFEATDGAVAIRVLGPIEYELEGKPALRNLGSSSKNTNGNSLLLRVDYGRARILLTGDLNAASQRALLEEYVGERVELQADVAKACHHGSDDVSYAFLSAIRPAATIISSGDNEGHDHPRPGVVAASATTGHLQIESDRIVTPLVYSTELSRSLNLGKPEALTVGDRRVEGDDLASVSVDVSVTKAGDLRPSRQTLQLGGTYLVAGLIYGLVNVRTDGETILCATLNEKDATWQVKKFRSRF